MVTRGEKKKTLQTSQRNMERRILQVVWSDRQTDESSNKKENQNKGTCGGAVAHSLRWNGGDQVARMDQRRWTNTASVWELRTGERRTGEQTRSGEKQKDSGHGQIKTGANGLAHLLIKLSNSVWFHEPAIRFMGLIRLIYLSFYLSIYLSIYLPIYLYIYLSIYLSIYLFIYLFILLKQFTFRCPYVQDV